MFETALIILSMVSSFVAVYLISQDPEFLTLSGTSCDAGMVGGDHDTAASSISLDCPSNTTGTICSNQGTCQAGSCSCEKGWVGDDCSQPACPENCNGRGVCYQGFCVCDNGWAGIKCDIDRLHVTTATMLDGIDLDAFSNTKICHFLYQKLFLEREGKFEYSSTSREETPDRTYHFPMDKLSALPEDCPDYRFETCAFVGNSGTMKYSNYGSEIDGHDMVYRFNQAPTHRYEAQVGSETTFESLNAKHAHNLAKQDTKWLWRDPVPIYLLFEPIKLKETVLAIHEKFPEVQVLVLSPEFASKAREIYNGLQSELEGHEFGCFSGEKPMSGFYSLLIAATMCDKIDMYGFEPWEDWMADGQSDLHYHYFDSEEPRPGAHSFDATFLMYRLVEMSKKVGLHIRTVQLPEELARFKNGGKDSSPKSEGNGEDEGLDGEE